MNTGTPNRKADALWEPDVDALISRARRLLNDMERLHYGCDDPACGGHIAREALKSPDQRQRKAGE